MMDMELDFKIAAVGGERRHKQFTPGCRLTEPSRGSQAVAGRDRHHGIYGGVQRYK